MSKKTEFLQEICREQSCCSEKDFCLLKEIIIHDAKYDDRLLCQIACVNKFKYEESQRQGKDIQWAGAWRIWVDSGAALCFSRVYESGNSISSVYKQIKDLMQGN